MVKNVNFLSGGSSNTYCSLYRAVFTSVLLQNHPFLFQLIAHYIELYSRELTEDESHELESNLIAHYIELYSQQYI